MDRVTADKDIQHSVAILSTINGARRLEVMQFWRVEPAFLPNLVGSRSPVPMVGSA